MHEILGGRRGTAILLATIFVLSLAQGVALSGFHTIVGYDASNYIEIAQNLVSGRGYTTSYISFPYLKNPIPHQDLYRPPLLVYFIAALFVIAGAGFEVAKLAPVIFGALLPIVTYLLGRELFGHRVGLISAVAVFLSGEVMFFSIQVLTETQFTFLFIASAYLLLRWYRTGSIRHVLAFGVMLGISFLSRPQALLMAPLLLPPVFFRKDSLRLAFSKKMLVQAVAAIVLFLIIAAPWMMRSFSLTGNPLHSDTDVLIRYAGSLNSESEMLSIDMNIPTLQQNILSNPAQFFLSWARRATHLFYETGPLLTPLIFAFSMFGILLSFRRYRLHAPLYCLMAVYLAFFALSFVISRYMFPLLPIFVVYSISGMHEFSGFFRSHQKAVFSVIIVASLGLSWLTGVNKIMEMHGAERVEWKAAGEWIMATGNTQPIMSLDPSIAYYAKSPWVVIPYNNLSETLEFARSYNVSYLIFDTMWDKDRPQLSELGGKDRTIEGLERANIIAEKRTVMIYKLD